MRGRPPKMSAHDLALALELHKPTDGAKPLTLREIAPKFDMSETALSKALTRAKQRRAKPTMYSAALIARECVRRIQAEDRANAFLRRMFRAA